MGLDDKSRLAFEKAARSYPFPIAVACKRYLDEQFLDPWREWEVLCRDVLLPTLTYLSHLLLSDLVALGRKPPHIFQHIQSILSRPMALKAGESFHYNSGCSVLLGGVVEFLESKSALEYAREFLFAPLGIRDFIWESHQQDILQCGHGLSLRPRDMAKAGLLVVNDGKWQEKQIVSDAWIRESTTPQVEESAYYDYGYHWWHRSDNKLQWWKEPNAASPGEHELINAMGHGGQYIIIIKDLNLVIVTTSSDFDDGRTAQSKIPMALEKIAPLFENE